MTSEYFIRNIILWLKLPRRDSLAELEDNVVREHVGTNKV